MTTLEIVLAVTTALGLSVGFVAGAVWHGLHAKKPADPEVLRQAMTRQGRPVVVISEKQLKWMQAERDRREQEVNQLQGELLRLRHLMAQERVMLPHGAVSQQAMEEHGWTRQLENVDGAEVWTRP